MQNLEAYDDIANASFSPLSVHECCSILHAYVYKSALCTCMRAHANVARRQFLHACHPCASSLYQSVLKRMAIFICWPICPPRSLGPLCSCPSTDERGLSDTDMKAKHFWWHEEVAFPLADYKCTDPVY